MLFRLSGSMRNARKTCWGLLLKVWKKSFVKKKMGDCFLFLCPLNMCIKRLLMQMTKLVTRMIQNIGPKVVHPLVTYCVCEWSYFIDYQNFESNDPRTVCTAGCKLSFGNWNSSIILYAWLCMEVFGYWN